MYSARQCEMGFRIHGRDGRLASHPHDYEVESTTDALNCLTGPGGWQGVAGYMRLNLPLAAGDTRVKPVISRAEKLIVLLTADELLELTRRPRPSAQARVLRALQIPFRVHPIDGGLLVDRELARTALGVQLRMAANDEPEAVAVNLEAIRNHGKKARAKRPR